MTTFHPFLRAWQARFGEVLPAGHLCRKALADRWLRIHSLPRSKRYAHTDAERAELLQRQNAVATHVLGEGEECVAFIARFGDSTVWDASEAALAGMTAPEHVLSAQLDGVGGERWQFFATPVAWRENAFDPLVLAVADEQIGGVLLANLQRGSVYAPYDGGADLFFVSPEAALAARLRFASWLSDRPDGL